MSKNATDSFNAALNNLIRAKDEARVGLHLLSLDARKKWDELETQATALEQKLGDGAERLTEMHASRAESFARSVEKFVDEHIRKTESGRRASAG